MKQKSSRSVYRLGFVDVMHKDGKKVPVSKKVYNNEALMMHLGYSKIVEPEQPSMPEEIEDVEPLDEMPIIKDEAEPVVKILKKTRKKKTVKKTA